MSCEKSILLIGQFTDISGYGTAVRSYLKSLASLHDSNQINLQILNWSFETSSSISPREYELIRRFSITDSLSPRSGHYTDQQLSSLKEFIENDYEVVFFLLNDWIQFGHQSSDLLYNQRVNLNHLCQQSKGVYPCVVWESDMVPKIWEDSYKTVEIKKLLCACEWNKETFSSLGYDSEVVPYGFDFIEDHDEEYYKNLLQVLSGKFVFTSVFQWGSRKGIEKLIKAFQLEFVHDEDAYLVLKTYHSKHMTGQDETSFIKGKISEITSSLKHYGRTVKPKCKIVVINKILSLKQLNSLYKITDVYATTTRGEGFGLPIVESLNYDNPVVAPTIGGHIDFLDKKSNLFIESSLEPVDGFDNSLWSSYEGNWVEASVNSTRKNLRKCYNLPKQDLSLAGQKAGKFMRNYLSIDRCNKIWQKVLEV